MKFTNLPFIKPFHYRDYRFLYLSEIAYFLPIWMAAMIFGLIATHIKGNSPFYVGLVGFGFNIPMLFGPLLGVIVDRSQRVNVMKYASLAVMLAAICMALLLMDGLPNYWLMVALILVYGFSNTFFYPSILTGAHDIIDDATVVGNAVGLINTTNRIVMFAGYALGGWFVIVFSEGFTYWFNSVLLLLGFIFLTQIKTRNIVPKEKKSTVSDLIAGFRYLKESYAVFSVIIILGLQGFLAWPYLFQIPVVNRYYLGGTPATLGILMAIGGLGGTVGGFLMSARKSSLHLTRLYIISNLLLSATMILLTLCKTIFFAAMVLFGLDFALLVSLTVAIVFIQHIVPKSFQGRIMGIVSMVCFGTIPFGSVIIYGGIGEPFGVLTAFLVAAILVFLSIIWFFTQLAKIRQDAVPSFMEKKLITTAAEINKI